MNIRNRFQVVIFFVLASFVLWLTLFSSTAYFVRPVPQHPEYCEEWVLLPKDSDAPETLAGSQHRCLYFINSLEKLKYEHNLRMVERNRIIIYTIMVIAFLSPLVFFHGLPVWDLS
jgi:peptidoglycan/LPS O-acetylase OafA/YrhL